MISMLAQNLSRFSFKTPSLRKSNLCFSLRFWNQSVIIPRVYEFSTKSELQTASVVNHSINPGSVSVFSFLKENGFSDSQLKKAVKCWPRLPFINVEKVIKPKLKIFQHFGLSAPDIAEILTNNPWIFYRSANEKIIPSLSVLKGLLGANDLPKYLKVSGWFFRVNLDHSLVPNIEFLRNCGVSMDQILWHLYYFPRFLLRNPEQMKKLVDRADAMGVRRTSKLFIQVIRVFNSMSDETWELKLQILRELGFSDDDIAKALGKFPGLFACSMKTFKLKLRILREVGFSDDDIATTFRNCPAVFTISEKKIKKTVDVILVKGKYNVSCITSLPVSLTFSVEKRYKPRIKVLELLEDKNLIQNRPYLSTLCLMTDKKFHERYVAPFFDAIGDVNMAKSCADDVK